MSTPVSLQADFRNWVTHKSVVWKRHSANGHKWRYKKIPQKEFEKLRPDDFDDLIALEPVRLL